MRVLYYRSFALFIAVKPMFRLYHRTQENDIMTVSSFFEMLVDSGHSREYNSDRKLL